MGDERTCCARVRDHYLIHGPFEGAHDMAQEVMRHRPGLANVLDLHRNGRRELNASAAGIRD